MGTIIDFHFLALCAILTVGYQFMLFIVTALLKFDKVTDFPGTTNFAIIAALTAIVKGHGILGRRRASPVSKQP